MPPHEDMTTIRTTHTSEDGFDLVVDNAYAVALWNRLIEGGALPIGRNVLEIFRIEAGIPRYGRDMDETNVVTEVNLDNAVSYTKVCYIGQEIIVRIKHRGHEAKKLTGLVFEDGEAIQAGAIIQSREGKDIGRITSAAISPCLRKTIALAYVRYEYLAPSTVVKVVADQADTTATVTELPLVRGSWYA